MKRDKTRNNEQMRTRSGAHVAVLPTSTSKGATIRSDKKKKVVLVLLPRLRASCAAIQLEVQTSISALSLNEA